MKPGIKQYPHVMAGKKILYVHGFASSGQSGTVVKIREMLPEAVVVAPDLPLHPEEAMTLLRRLCDEERPDLIIGTSMGGMYTEMLYGYDRILVNPAFELGETMRAHGMIGKNTFQNPRLDGVQEFIVTKALVNEYKDITEKCFQGVTDDEQKHVWGLFGDNDPAVDTRGLFCEHYTRDVSFHGEHRMNDKILINSVIPVIRWIDDMQEGRERPVVYIGINALWDSRGNQQSSAVKAFRYLLENYTVYVVAPAPDYDTDYVRSVQEWVKENINVPAYGHLIFTNSKNLLYGDYLIDPDCGNGADEFMGTRIVFGDDTFKTWEEIIEFFGRLGGQ